MIKYTAENTPNKMVDIMLISKMFVKTLNSLTTLSIKNPRILNDKASKAKFLIFLLCLLINFYCFLPTV